ncbi:Thymidylate kinase [Caloramator mitchellensis]|uniref:Thymidylate kinase n=1 Tax=Caloramator mitchellensis TaxID=908809 RepID=A0A0R3K1L7_CALMK|nr:thymidylate kinase [Caloramator mitchellensis]KRQ86770.1 Thymidylate kinase [Caloramator mitchellensis]
MGKLIIIDGTDGSGKATQSQKLVARLEKEGYKVRKVEFPNYKSESSALIKMYLNGEFGENPEDVNYFAASAFYAVDRFASFKMEWENFYNEGGIIIADRYTTSNMVHQAAKIKDLDEKNSFLDWIYDLEYNKFKLPMPDLVLFLNMPPEYSFKLMEDRKNKFTGDKDKDIHEKNKDYIENSYRNAIYCAERYGWAKVDCVNQGIIRSIDEIHDDIYKAIITII